MAGSPPNLHMMDSRSAYIQGVLKVKVKVKGHVIRALSWIFGMSYSVIYGLVFYRAMHCIAKRGPAIACRPSVCPSVRPFVTLVDYDHIGWESWKLIARTIILKIKLAPFYGPRCSCEKCSCRHIHYSRLQRS